ncbi:hypothetical protein PHMEG_00025488 [Phytophthora megakarya]|uniref:Polyprotein n=1 Tax=Phytophthora megakarya TaxID=4795 RepID=A0A225VDK1_9STRA|nr:hypothetical protein PHMEG_00025488 [Phytophthora megakarya]
MPYRQAVGALPYLSRVTRSDIAFAVNQAAGQSNKPSARHWHAVKRILRYVSTTTSMGLVFRRSVDAPHACLYTDADWTNDVTDRKSVSGELLQVYGCNVHGSCRRQDVVAKSSTTAEYVAADMSLENLRWLIALILELNGAKLTKVPMFIDNKSTIHIIENEKISKAQKSIGIAFHSIKDALHKGDIKLEYYPTTWMLADGFTKALGNNMFQQLRDAIGLVPLDSDPASRGSVDASGTT